MFTTLDSHLPAVVETGLAPASIVARGARFQADAAALARRIAP
jgi:hypothetical protein